MIQNPAIQGGGVEHEAMSLTLYPDVNSRTGGFQIKVEKSKMKSGCMVLVSLEETFNGPAKFILWFEPDGLQTMATVNDPPYSSSRRDDENAYYFYLFPAIEDALGRVADAYYAYI